MSSTILITGATAGIGRHAALHLARAGHHVIASGRRDAALAAVVAESGGAITPVVLDVDDPASIAAAAAEVDRLTGGRGLDVLINNAGYATVGALAELSDHHLRAQFETNVFGLMAVTRAFLPAMLARGSGRVINVSSVSGRIPAPLLGAYHASKYALEALSDALRMELAPLGVQVVLIEPGTIKTGFATRTKAEIALTRPARSYYDAVYAQVDAMEATFARMAADPIHVTRAIDRAIRARRPAARYVAPRRFLALIALIRLLPTCWVDAAMKRTFGLARLGPGTPT
jgi:NAD(P)-dependent dehydrogenase (short-subunit alcohol dehydrogenase family)